MQNLKKNNCGTTKKNIFSLIIDETTDIGTTKFCGIVAKYYNHENLKIYTKLLSIENIFSKTENTYASGERLYDIIMS